MKGQMGRRVSTVVNGVQLYDQEQPELIDTALVVRDDLAYLDNFVIKLDS